VGRDAIHRIAGAIKAAQPRTVRVTVPSPKQLLRAASLWVVEQGLVQCHDLLCADHPPAE
jgi:hypothetical protein